MLSANTYKFLREKAQVELVPEGSLTEAEADEDEDADGDDEAIETAAVEVVADDQ